MGEDLIAAILFYNVSLIILFLGISLLVVIFVKSRKYLVRKYLDTNTKT